VRTKPDRAQGHSAVVELWEGMNMRTILARLWNEEEGQDLTEYALLLVLIALASMVALTPLASAINSVFSNAAVNLNAST
jgi:Flp pilus assembly pilin Flp